MPKYNVDAKLGSRPSTANETQKDVHSENSRLNSALDGKQSATAVVEESIALLVTKCRQNLLIRRQFVIKHGHLIVAEHRRHGIFSNRGLLTRAILPRRGTGFTLAC